MPIRPSIRFLASQLASEYVCPIASVSAVHADLWESPHCCWRLVKSGSDDLLLHQPKSAPLQTVYVSLIDSSCVLLAQMGLLAVKVLPSCSEATFQLSSNLCVPDLTALCLIRVSACYEIFCGYVCWHADTGTSMSTITIRSSLQLQLLSRSSQTWLSVNSKSTDPTFDPCLGHFQIYFKYCHQVL